MNARGIDNWLFYSYLIVFYSYDVCMLLLCYLYVFICFAYVFVCTSMYSCGVLVMIVFIEEDQMEGLLNIIVISRIILAYYCKCCYLIGYSARYLATCIRDI